jgi:predicted Zn finger-like uncharacterized protein
MSDTFAATCPTCRAEYRIPAKYAGKGVKCKKCGGTIPATRPAAAPAKLATAKPLPAEPAAVYTPPAVAEPAADFAVADPVIRTTRGRKKAGPGPVVWAALGVLVAVAGAAAAVGLVMLKDGAADGPAVVAAPPTQATRPAPPPTTPVAPPAKFPRRMLVLNVSKYLYCNGLTAGEPGKKANGDRVTEVADRLAYDWHVPTDKDNNQLYIVSDTTGRGPRPMIGPVLRAGYELFFATCRPQDNVLVYFGGHAVEADGKAYLVPADGDPTDAKTLIPLADFYDKLKDCVAHQKVVLFDVCRLNEAGDQVRPGGEPMTPTLEKALLDAPAGTQVVLACSAGQRALEFRRPPADAPEAAGSLFLAALRSTTAAGKKEPEPTDPFPVDAWGPKLKARMAEVAAMAGQPAPEPKTTGRDPGPTEVAADAPPAKPMPLPSAPKGANPADVRKLIAPAALPPLRPGESAAEQPVETAVPFPAAALKPFEPDLVTPDVVKKDKEKYPVRAAALDALDYVRAQWGMAGKNVMDRFDGATNEAVKKTVRGRQEAPARIILELEERSRAMDALLPEAEKETSKYWKVTFLLALAEVKARLAFMHEYDNALAAIMTDNLPDRDPKKHSGLQLVSSDKMKSKKDVKDIGDAARELYAKVVEEAPGTPWAVLARRAKATGLGLAWQPLPKPTISKDE